MARMHSDGPYIFNEFSTIAILLAPFWQRFLTVEKHCRDFERPKDEASFTRLEKWWNDVSNRPSVARTIVSPD